MNMVLMLGIVVLVGIILLIIVIVKTTQDSWSNQKLEGLNEKDVSALLKFLCLDKKYLRFEKNWQWVISDIKSLSDKYRIVCEDVEDMKSLIEILYRFDYKTMIRSRHGFNQPERLLYKLVNNKSFPICVMYHRYDEDWSYEVMEHKNIDAYPTNKVFIRFKDLDEYVKGSDK